MRPLLYLLFLLPTSVQACSCLFSETFCSYLEGFIGYEQTVVIARAKLLDFRTPPVDGYAPLYDFRLTEVMTGNYSDNQTVSLWGQDGCNCNGPIMRLNVGDEYLIFFPEREDYFTCYSGLRGGIPNPYPIHDFPGCGPAALTIRGNQVRGPIRAGLSQAGMSSLRAELEECLGLELEEAPGTIPERIEATIFPNPAQEDFVIRWENEVSVEEVTLYNAAGRLVAREKLDGSATKQRTVDVSQLPAGVYFVVLETDGVRIKEQVVVF